MLRKVKLTEHSINYIKEELTLGRTLSHRLLEIDIDLGYVFTYLPLKFSLENQIDYKESLSFLIGRKVFNEFHAVISSLILDFLDMNPSRFAVFETLQSINDPIVNKKQIQYFTINGSVYDYIKGDDEKKLIGDYMADASGYPRVITLINIPENGFTITGKSELNSANISKLVKYTEILLIGAFDDEGFLVWQRN